MYNIDIVEWRVMNIYYTHFRIHANLKAISSTILNRTSQFIASKYPLTGKLEIYDI